MTKRYTLTLILTVMSIVIVGNAQERELSSPTPTIDWNLNPYHFPTSLYCEDIDTSSNNGSEWRQITIGQSSLNELDILVRSLSEIYETVGMRGSWILYSASDSQEIEKEGLPGGIRACILNDTVWLLQLSTVTDNPDYQIFLPDMVVEYGLPDVITWSESFGTRLAFWFEQGIVAEIVIADLVGSAKGEVYSILYIPYQENEGFESRYPYNRTRQTPPIAGDAIHNPPLLTEQNPFDFDSMIATITAEPSRTPTPTLMPMATATP